MKKTQKSAPFFLPVCGYLFSLVGGIISITIFGLVSSCIGIIAGIFLILRYSTEWKIHGIIIFIISIILVLYSYGFFSIIGKLFNWFEIIHVIGLAAILVYGLIWLINAIFLQNKPQDETHIKHRLFFFIAIGIIIMLIGILWFIVILYYFGRFFYWPVFWVLTSLNSLLCLGTGIFSLYLFKIRKELLGNASFQGNTGVFYSRILSVLRNRYISIIFLSSSILVMIYHSFIFPVIGL